MERKPNNYWTKERVFEKAKEYPTKNAFRKGCGGAYNVALKNEWIKEMDWFEEVYKPSGYWTYERCYEVAMECNSRPEIRKNNKVVFNKAYKYGWIKDYYWFVDGRIEKYTRKDDSVYKYYWEETNTIYIGRTLVSRQKIRHRDHSTDEEDTVFRYAKENGLDVPPMEIIEEGITPIEALEREDYWVNYYKEKGYNVLNKAKTGVGSGSLGGINCGKWTEEKILEEASLYKTMSAFCKGSPGAYNAAGRLDLFKTKINWFINGRIKWTDEKIIEEGSKYKSRWDFGKNNGAAYQRAKKQGLLDVLFPKAS